MPRRKRRTKKQPQAAPAPEPIAKIKKRRRRKPVAQPVVLSELEPKTLMDRIFEAQRQQLERLKEEIRAKVVG